MSIVAGNPGEIQRVNEFVLANPFHRFAGLRLARQEPGKAIGNLHVDGNVLNMAETLHSGMLYGLLDAIGFLALVTILKPKEYAATQDMHVCLLRTVPKGEDIELRGEVIRRSTNSAFIRSEAWRLSRMGDELVATAMLTKSLTMGKD
jgi:acyl-coenzyme A thioesterase PaaI-like protein